MLAGFLVTSDEPHAPAALVKGGLLDTAGHWHSLARCTGVGISGTCPPYRRVIPAKPSTHAPRDRPSGGSYRDRYESPQVVDRDGHRRPANDRCPPAPSVGLVHRTVGIGAKLPVLRAPRSGECCPKQSLHSPAEEEFQPPGVSNVERC